MAVEGEKLWMERKSLANWREGIQAVSSRWASQSHPLTISRTLICVSVSCEAIEFFILKMKLTQIHRHTHTEEKLEKDPDHLLSPRNTAWHKGTQRFLGRSLPTLTTPQGQDRTEWEWYLAWTLSLLLLTSWISLEKYFYALCPSFFWDKPLTFDVPWT